MIAVIFVILLLREISAGILPRNEYVYSIDRERLVQNEKEYASNAIYLNQVSQKTLLSNNVNMLIV